MKDEVISLLVLSRETSNAFCTMIILVISIVTLSSCTTIVHSIKITTQHSELEGRSQIKGHVADVETAQALPFMVVAIEGTMLAGQTDSLGNYVISRITPGTYALKVFGVAYQTVIENGITIPPNTITTIDLKLVPIIPQIYE